MKEYLVIDDNLENKLLDLYIIVEALDDGDTDLEKILNKKKVRFLLDLGKIIGCENTFAHRGLYKYRNNNCEIQVALDFNNLSKFSEKDQFLHEIAIQIRDQI